MAEELNYKIGFDVDESSLDRLKNLDSKLKLKELKAQLSEGAKNIEFLTSNLKNMEKEVEDARKKMILYEEGVKAAQENLDSVANKDPLRVGQALKQLEDAKNRLNAFSKETGYTLKAFEEYSQGLKDAQEQQESLTSQTKELEESNYNLTYALNKAKRQLQLLREEGKQDTQEYQDLLQSVVELDGKYKTFQQDLQNLSKQGLGFRTMIESLQLLSGTFSTAMGVSSLFTNKEEELAKIQTKLQSVISITTGLQSVYNAVQEKSSLMSAIRTIQLKAESKAIALKRVNEIAGTKATKLAIVQQKIFNFVAKQNPYVLLATAILSVVGAMAGWYYSTKKQSEEQKKLNDELRKHKSNLEDIEVEYKFHEDKLRALGKNEKEIHKAKLEYFAKERVELNKALDVAQKMDDTEALEEILSKIEDFNKEVNEEKRNWNNYQIKLEKERKDKVLDIEEQLKNSRINIQKSITTDKKKLLDLELKQTINAIDKEIEEYKRLYGERADITVFEQEKALARQQTNISKGQVDKEFGEKLKTLQLQTIESSTDYELQILKNKIEFTKDLNDKLKYQRELRQKTLNIEIQELEIQRDRDVLETKKIYGDEKAKQVENEWNARIESERLKLESQIRQEDIKDTTSYYDNKLNVSKDYIENQIELLLDYNSKVKAINENKDLTSSEKEKQINDLTKLFNFDKGVVEHLLLGVGGQEGLDKVINDVMNMTLDELIKQYNTLQTEIDSEIERLSKDKEEGKVVSDESLKSVTDLQVKLSATDKAIDKFKNKVGNTNKELTKLEKAEEIFKGISNVVGGVTEAFGENVPDEIKNVVSSIEELTKSVLDAIEEFKRLGDSVVDVVSKTTEGAETLVETSGEAMKTTSAGVSTSLQAMESATVILAIIGAVIKVINAIKQALQSQQQAQEESLQKAKQFKKDIQKLEIEKANEGGKGSNIFGTFYDPKSAQESLELAKKNIEDNYKDIQDFNKRKLDEYLFEQMGNKSLLSSLGVVDTKNFYYSKKKYEKGMQSILDSVTDYSNQLEKIVVKSKDYNGFMEFFGKRDEFKNLEDFAKDLGVALKDANGEYNLDALKKISETYEKELGDAKIYIDSYIEAQENLQSVIEAQNAYYEDIFGGLSTSIVDYFWDMYTGSEDAMEALEDSFGSMLVKMVKQSAITAVIQPMLDKLMANLKDENGLFKSEEDMTAIIGDFFGNINTMKDSIFSIFDSIGSVAQAYGIDIKEGADKLVTATAGGFESMSQDTAEELNGRFTALQIYGYEINQNVANMAQDMKVMSSLQSDIRYQLELNQDAMQDIMQNVREINANTSHLLQMKNDLSVIKSRL